MRTVTVVVVGAALALGAAVVHADDSKRARAAARQAKAGQEHGGNEITGRVVRADSRTLYIRHMGAVVAFKIDDGTRFTGGGIRTSSDLSEGQDVRASFTVEGKTTNVAKRVSVVSAAGAPRDDRGPSDEGDAAAGGVQEGPPTIVPSPPGLPPAVPPGERPPRDPGTLPPRDPGTIPTPR